MIRRNQRAWPRGFKWDLPLPRDGDVCCTFCNLTVARMRPPIFHANSLLMRRASTSLQIGVRVVGGTIRYLVCFTSKLVVLQGIYMLKTVVRICCFDSTVLQYTVCMFRNCFDFGIVLFGAWEWGYKRLDTCSQEFSREPESRGTVFSSFRRLGGV